jgi:hypothetical protein
MTLPKAMRAPGKVIRVQQLCHAEDQHQHRPVYSKCRTDHSYWSAAWAMLMVMTADDDLGRGIALGPALDSVFMIEPWGSVFLMKFQDHGDR